MPGGTSSHNLQRRSQGDNTQMRIPARRPNRAVLGDAGPSRLASSTPYQGRAASPVSTVGGILNHYAGEPARYSTPSPLESRTVNNGTRTMSATERDQQQAQAISQHVQRFIDQHHAAEDLDLSQHTHVTPSSDSGERSALFLRYMSSLQNSLAERQSRGEQGTSQTGDSNDVNVRDEVSAETEQAGDSNPDWQTTTHGNSSDSDESTGLEMYRRG